MSIEAAYKVGFLLFAIRNAFENGWYGYDIDLKSYEPDFSNSSSPPPAF